MAERKLAQTLLDHWNELAKDFGFYLYAFVSMEPLKDYKNEDNYDVWMSEGRCYPSKV